MKTLLSVFILLIILTTSALAAVSVDRLLQQQVVASPLNFQPVVITFDHRPTNADFLMLKALGITGGRYTRELPIVLTKINKTQFDALRQKSGIRSLYANHIFEAFDAQSNEFIGVNRLLRDTELTT